MIIKGAVVYEVIGVSVVVSNTLTTTHTTALLGILLSSETSILKVQSLLLDDYSMS